jgi:HK97 family phage major capsid protein
MTVKEYTQQQMEAKLKKLAKDKVLKTNKDEKSEDRAIVSKFFEAVASNDPQKTAEYNELAVKDYEAKGIEWREEGELKTKAQTVGTAGQGGYLVPTILRDSIIEKLYYISPMRQLSTVINDMPAILDMPYDNALPTTYWVGEGASITESGATFAKKTLTPYKLAGLDKFTSESLADTVTNPSLQNVVEDRFVTSIALAENAAFVSGDGSSKPFGFRSSDISPTSNPTNSAAGNLAFTDILTTKYLLPTAYRPQAVWVTSSTGLKLIQSIKDANGRPVYLPGVAGLDGNVRDSFMGQPIYIVDEIPTNLGTGTNETELWYAGFKNYWIGTRGGFRMDYGTDGTDFSLDKISLRMIERVAGRPFMDTAWVKMNIK